MAATLPAMAVKRAFPLGVTFGAPAAKAPRSDEGNWTCTKCGNSNYANRLFCNMRKCGAPKTEEPWICPGCGNENFPNRMFCNMRKCQLARPGLTAQTIKQVQVGKVPPTLGGAGMLSAPPSPFSTGATLAQAPGSWTCSACNNVNYPGRTHCNSRKCGKPRTAQDTSVPVTGMGMGMPMLAAPMVRQTQAAPEGSWMCTSCQNINWPTRTQCNARNCGQPRSAVDGGYPASANASAAPPGSWVCNLCNNVNWPTREACNKKGCENPRPF